MTVLHTDACPTSTVSSDRVVSGDRAVESDLVLIRRFVHEHDQDAFESLMQRHGPMVMGVCRRILANCQDAEDACQATFLLLVQKGGSIRRPEQLASWLFGVAQRIATRLKVRAARRRSSEMLSPEASMDAEVDDSTREAMRHEAFKVLDEEISNLPEKHRLPLILCYLQSKTHVEAAKEQGCPIGSMSDRLTQARESLRRRLTRRGVYLTASLLASLLSRENMAAEMPTRLIEYTGRAAMLTVAGKAEVGQVVSNSVAEAIEEFKRSLIVSNVKSVAIVVLMLAVVVSMCDHLFAVAQGQTETSFVMRSVAVGNSTVRDLLHGNLFFRRQLPVIYGVIRELPAKQGAMLGGCHSELQTPTTSDISKGQHVELPAIASGPKHEKTH